MKIELSVEYMKELDGIRYKIENHSSQMDSIVKDIINPAITPFIFDFSNKPLN